MSLGLIGKYSVLSTLYHRCGFACQQRVLLKMSCGPGNPCHEDGVVWLWNLLVNLCISLINSSCYDSVPLALGLIWWDAVLSTLCHSCGFSSHQKALKTFSGFGCLHCEDGLVWLWHLLVNLCISFTIWSCYCSILLVLGFIGRDGGLSTLCHSCRFACQQRMLKMFSGHGCLCSMNGVVWL